MSTHSLRRQALRAVPAFLLLALAAGPAHADDWPTKPIRLIVTYPPGGGADIVARLVAARMTETLGQQIVVENRPGANGQIGASAVVRSAPDGYTVLLDATGFSINPSLYPQLPYDSRKDFEPVSVLVRFPNILVKNPKYPVADVKALTEAARKSPGAISYASSGTGSVQHLAAAMFASKQHVEMTHIPYKGGGPALTDVAGGQVPIMFANGASALPFIQSSKVVPLATTGAQRSAGLPEVPTLAEAGAASMQAYEWNALFVPAGTPAAVVDKLSAAAHAAVTDAKVNQQLTDMGGEPLGSTPAESASFIAQQMKDWSTVIAENHIKLN